MKIVLDTNVLVSGLLSSQGAPAAVLRFVLAGSASVCFDEEWNQQLPPPKVAPERLAQDILAALRDGFKDLYLGDLAQEWGERWRVC